MQMPSNIQTTEILAGFLFWGRGRVTTPPPRVFTGSWCLNTYENIWSSKLNFFTKEVTSFWKHIPGDSGLCWPYTVTPFYESECEYMSMTVHLQGTLPDVCRFSESYSKSCTMHRAWDASAVGYRLNTGSMVLLKNRKGKSLRVNVTTISRL